jgi:endonuclease/exonuclease/phosphatase family metal-dependent hydrolase
MAAGTKKKQSRISKKKKPLKSVFYGLTSRMAMVIIAILLGISCLSFVVNPAKFWMISLFGIAFFPLLAANVILFVWAIIRRSKAAIIPMLALLPCLFFLNRYVQLPSGSSEDVDADIKMVSYNLGRFSLSSEKEGVANREQCVDSIFAYLKGQDADIICLQEFYLTNSNVKSYVRKHFPDYHAEYYMFPGEYGSFGNVTLSKIPVSDKGVIKFEKSANLAIYTDHRIGERRFRVYNCHFESYNISFAGLAKGLFRGDGEVFAETGSKMKKSISRRPKQVDKVFSDIESCPYEAFVCGDFNDNPMSYTYYRMTRGRKDAFVKGGSGFGATYSHLWPMLRIDYVLVPDRYKAKNCEVHKVKFSDHYPVVAEIKF